MYRVLVNLPFEDRHTGDNYVAGDVIQLSEKRVAEVQEVDKRFITVLGKVEAPKPKTTKKKSAE